MKLNEKQKIALTALVFTVLLGALLTVNYFKFKDRDKLLAKIDTLRKEEQKANDMIRQIPELREKRARLASIIDEYTTILPKEENITHEAFAEIVDNYSRETRVVIQKVEYLKQKEENAKPGAAHAAGIDDNFERHRYRIQLVGTFPDFLRFVNRIENHQRFLKIDETLIKPLGFEREISDNSRDETAVLDAARVKFKSIELVVSTYTYKKESVSK